MNLKLSNNNIIFNKQKTSRIVVGQHTERYVVAEYWLVTALHRSQIHWTPFTIIRNIGIRSLQIQLGQIAGVLKFFPLILMNASKMKRAVRDKRESHKFCVREWKLNWSD